jgi:hypothetical protein
VVGPLHEEGGEGVERLRVLPRGDERERRVVGPLGGRVERLRLRRLPGARLVAAGARLLDLIVGAPAAPARASSARSYWRALTRAIAASYAGFAAGSSAPDPDGTVVVVPELSSTKEDEPSSRMEPRADP